MRKHNNGSKGTKCYDPPPFFSSPSTVTYTPAVPVPAPSAPPQHVHHPPAAPAPSHPAAVHSRHHSPQPMEDQRAELQLAETEPGPRPVLLQLDTETMQQPPVSRAPSAALPSSDHLPFPMLTDDIAPTKYALAWLAGHPGHPMQGEGLETVQVPSVCPLSPNSPVSPQRHCRLSSGGYTTNQPASPEDIPLSPELEGQAASPIGSQSQASMSRHGPVSPLSALLPFTPISPHHSYPLEEASPATDNPLPGGYSG